MGRCRTWVDVSWVEVAMGRCLMGRFRLTVPEGEQKPHKYTSFAKSALYTGNYDLHVLVIITD